MITARRMHNRVDPTRGVTHLCHALALLHRLCVQQRRRRRRDAEAEPRLPQPLAQHQPPAGIAPPVRTAPLPLRGDARVPSLDALVVGAGAQGRPCGASGVG